MFPRNLFLGDSSLALQFLMAMGVSLLAKLPLGSISILTIQRAVTLGFCRAFLPTLGAMMGNAIFGVLAALGSGYLSTRLMGGRIWFQPVAGAVLMFIGARLLTSGRRDGLKIGESFGLGQLGFLMFILVIANPLTLGFYIAAFAAMGFESPAVLSWQSFILGGGILVGTVVWFVSLCALAGRFHHKLNDSVLERIRKVVGIFILFLGVLSVSALLVKL